MKKHVFYIVLHARNQTEYLYPLCFLRIVFRAPSKILCSFINFFLEIINCFIFSKQF